MKLQVIRTQFGNDATNGMLFINGLFECYTLEDQYQAVKVWGETCIGEGSDKIKFKKWGGFHEKYKVRYGADHYGMLHVQDVPNFTNCYIHVGNTESNTDGCLLPNTNVSLVNGEWVGGDSGGVYKPLYERLSKELDEGYEVWLNVRDEKYFKSPF